MNTDTYDLVINLLFIVIVSLSVISAVGLMEFLARLLFKDEYLNSKFPAFGSSDVISGGKSKSQEK